MMRSTLWTLTKQTMGRVRRRTSTKQRSIMLVVRKLAPQMAGTTEERQQLRQIPLQLANQAGIVPLPPGTKAAKCRLCLLAVCGLIDGLDIGFDWIVISPAHFLQ